MGDIVELVTPGPIERIVPNDPADDVLVATALAATADLIVSGDRNVLAVGSYRGVDILSVHNALSHIADAAS